MTSEELIAQMRSNLVKRLRQVVDQVERWRPGDDRPTLYAIRENLQCISDDLRAPEFAANTSAGKSPAGA